MSSISPNHSGVSLKQPADLADSKNVNTKTADKQIDAAASASNSKCENALAITATTVSAMACAFFAVLSVGLLGAAIGFGVTGFGAPVAVGLAAAAAFAALSSFLFGCASYTASTIIEQ